MQEFQGYISPGILAAFVFGLFVKRAPASAGVAALALSAPIYGFLHWQFSSIVFLNRMAITLAILLVIMTVLSILKPLPEPRIMPVKKDFDMRPAPSVLWLGITVVVITIALYIKFW